MVTFQALVQASMNRWPPETIAKIYFNQLSGNSAEDLVETIITQLSSHWGETKAVLKASIEDENIGEIRQMLVDTQGFDPSQADTICENATVCRKLLVRLVISQAIETKYPSIANEISQSDALCAKLQTTIDKLVDTIVG